MPDVDSPGSGPLLDSVLSILLKKPPRDVWVHLHLWKFTAYRFLCRTLTADLFQAETRGCMLLSATAVLGPRGQLQQAWGLWGLFLCWLLSHGSNGQKPCRVSDLGALGARLSGGSLKIWGPNPSFFREKLGFVGSLLMVCSYAGGTLGARVCLTFLTQCGIFLAHLLCGNCPASLQISCRGILLCVSVDSMYLWEEASSGNSYTAILSKNHSLSIFKILSYLPQNKIKL